MAKRKSEMQQPKLPIQSAKEKRMQNLRFWAKGESGNPNGRPRSMLSLLEDSIQTEFQVSLSKGDKMHIIESLLELSIKQLNAIAKSREAPAFLVLVAKAIITDYDDGSLKSVQNIFDRIYGKAHIQVPERPEEIDPIAELMKSNSGNV